MYKPIYFLLSNKKFSTNKILIQNKSIPICSTNKIFIRNKSIPICSNCLHFIEHKNNYPYDPIPSNEKFGRCKKFGEVDMVSGIIKYDLAIHCRLNDSKCGIIASEFIEK